jgi:arylsulfatase A-like enzyme
VFSRTYAQSTETLFSHASLFSGRYASELSTVDYHFSYPDNVPTMAEVLGLYGYWTGAAVAGGHLSPAFGLGQGFQHYEGPEEWGSLWHTAPAALRWVDGLDSQPFFLFVHGYDTHARYLKPAPAGYLYTSGTSEGHGQALVRSIHGTGQVVDGIWHPRRRFEQLFALNLLRPHTAKARAHIQPDANAIKLSKADLARVRAVYDGAVTYADLQVGLLMGELEERGLLDRAWVIVLSDHGEELGEHGLFDHRLHMSEELLHVPLIIRPPGGMEGGGRSSRLTSLIDLMPTVMELAGVPAPAGLHGTSLVPTLSGGHTPAPAAVFAEGPWRMVSAVDEGGGLMFTGLSAHSTHLSQALQATPLSSPAFETWGSPDKSRLQASLKAWRTKLSPHTPRPSADNEARRKILQQRGYWGAP